METTERLKALTEATRNDAKIGAEMIKKQGEDSGQPTLFVICADGDKFHFFLTPAPDVRPPDIAGQVLGAIGASGRFDIDYAVFGSEAWLRTMHADEYRARGGFQPGDLAAMHDAGDEEVVTVWTSTGIDCKGENYPTVTATGYVEGLVEVLEPNRTEGYVHDCLRAACRMALDPEIIAATLAMGMTSRSTVSAMLALHGFINSCAIYTERDPKVAWNA